MWGSLLHWWGCRAENCQRRASFHAAPICVWSSVWLAGGGICHETGGGERWVTSLQHTFKEARRQWWASLNKQRPPGDTPRQTLWVSKRPPMEQGLWGRQHHTLDYCSLVMTWSGNHTLSCRLHFFFFQKQTAKFTNGPNMSLSLDFRGTLALKHPLYVENRASDQ